MMDIARCLSLILLFSATFASAQIDFCVASVNGTTYNLSTIEPDIYNGTIVGEGLYGPVNVAMSWCSQATTSTLCNVSDYALAIDNGACIAAFSVIIGPIVVTPSGITFQLWSPDSGSMGEGTIICDQQGTLTSAKLIAPVYNDPIYTYTFQFSSKAACGGV